MSDPSSLLLWLPAIGFLAVTLLLVVLVVRQRRLAHRLDQLTRGADEGSLEAVLGQHLERVRRVARDVDDVAARTSTLERDVRQSLGRVGLVRYNPFDDTGGNQSFALAVLDAAGDGFVVNALHARAGTRVYAKGVTAGKSDVTLSDEESQALRQALARPATAPGR